MHFTWYSSSLHNIILNVFHVILVLWRLLFLVEAFSFLHHSCSKKFLWRWKVHIVWVGLYTKSVSYLSQNTQPRNNNNDISSPLELFLNNYDIRKRKHCLGERESPTSNNRLHDTKTTRKTFNIILWRLLQWHNVISTITFSGEKYELDVKNFFGGILNDDCIFGIQLFKD